MFTFSAVSTLQKTAGAGLTVGGIASSFHRDLDGEAITPDAVRAAIPDFMAPRSGNIEGGAIRLHHNFWDRLLKRVISSLPLPYAQQNELVAAIALPLGRVTKIWVDNEGQTHWRGILSAANPIAKVVWDMLKEGAVHLGVSLGGKIFETVPGGRDSLGKPCTLITKIRIDELSVTDNPALRLPGGEGEGAYINALAKSVRNIMPVTTLRPKPKKLSTQAFLLKAIGGSVSSEQASGDWGGYTSGLSSDRGLQPRSKRPRSTRRIAKYDETNVKSGLGGKHPMKSRPKATDSEPKTDVYGMTVGQLTQKLKKACQENTRDDWGSKEMTKSLADAALGIAGVTDSPTAEVVNFAKFLQHLSQFTASLPHMSDYQAIRTVPEFGAELSKALDTFTDSSAFKELEEKPLRPPGRVGVTPQSIMFPNQYVVYS